jgi:hypothetical protein
MRSPERLRCEGTSRIATPGDGNPAAGGFEGVHPGIAPASRLMASARKNIDEPKIATTRIWIAISDVRVIGALVEVLSLDPELLRGQAFPRWAVTEDS